MKYTTYLNNAKILEWGLNFSQAVVFDWLTLVPGWAEQMIEGKEVWYFASRTTCLKELPTVGTSEDTIYRIYKALEKLGLIEYKKVGVKDYIKLSKKAKEWHYKDLGKKSEHSEIYPNDLGNPSENDSDENPTYNNITLDNNISNNKKKSKNKPLQEINTCEEVKEMPFNIQAKAKVKELIPDYYFDETYDWKALTEIDYYLVNFLQAQEEILGTKIGIGKRLEAFEVLIRHVLENEKWFTFDLSGINKNKNKFWNACKSDLGTQSKSDNWNDFMAKHYLDRDIPQFNSVYQRNNILADLTRDIVSRLRAIGEIDKAIVIEMQYQKVEWEELYKLALDQIKFTQAEYEKIAIW